MVLAVFLYGARCCGELRLHGVVEVRCCGVAIVKNSTRFRPGGTNMWPAPFNSHTAMDIWQQHPASASESGMNTLQRQQLLQRAQCEHIWQWRSAAEPTPKLQSTHSHRPWSGALQRPRHAAHVAIHIWQRRPNTQAPILSKNPNSSCYFWEKLHSRCFVCFAF